MNTKTKPFSNIRVKKSFGQFRTVRLLALGGSVALASVAVESTAHAQQFDKNPVTERLSPTTSDSIIGGESGDAKSRGINRAAESLLQGGSVEDAARAGMREGVQTATETPAQTQMRDRQAIQQSNDINTVYRDASGRTFTLTPQGQRVYSNQPVEMRNGQPFRANAANATNSNSNSRPSLGVGLLDADNGLMVETVRPGSVAAQAGLQPGDMITAFNGQKVRNVDTIQQGVANVDVSQPVDIQIVRDGQRQMLTANFDGQSATGDRYQSAKPATESGSELRSEVDQLKREVNELRTELQKVRDVMKNHAPADGFGKPNEGSDTNQ